MRARIDDPVQKKLYCGTCKSIGVKYSQKTRFFLNHDVVWLAEIYSILDPGHISAKAAKKFDHLNCFNNISEEEIPPVFEYIAAVNVLLAQFKIEDNFKDERSKFFWWGLKRIYKRDINKALLYLNKLSPGNGYVEKWSAENNIRESLGCNDIVDGPAAHLAYYAEPTAAISGMIFRGGSQLIDAKGCADKLYIMGELFGKIVYLLDSIEDYTEDVEMGRFNWIARSDFRVSEAMSLLDDLIQQQKACIEELPITISARKYLFNSLAYNILNRREGKRRSIAGAAFRMDVYKQWLKNLFKNPNPLLAFRTLVVLPFLTPEILEGIYKINGNPMVERVPICCAPFICCCGWICGNDKS